jgi:hypothetical protein
VREAEEEELARRPTIPVRGPKDVEMGEEDTPGDPE